MPCSAVTLSLATICAVISVALLAIAFSTDNWLRIDVKRDKLKVRISIWINYQLVIIRIKAK